MRGISWIKAIAVATALGLLEAAWTTPTMGGPRDAILGCFAILIVLIITTWPKIWRIFGLAILEEWTQGYVGTLGHWIPTYNAFFNHWSTQYLHFNIYPYILFPVITLVGEILWWKLKGSKYSIQNHSNQS